MVAVEPGSSAASSTSSSTVAAATAAEPTFLSIIAAVSFLIVSASTFVLAENAVDIISAGSFYYFAVLEAASFVLIVQLYSTKSYCSRNLHLSYRHHLPPLPSSSLLLPSFTQAYPRLCPPLHCLLASPTWLLGSLLLLLLFSTLGTCLYPE